MENPEVIDDSTLLQILYLLINPTLNFSLNFYWCCAIKLCKPVRAKCLNKVLRDQLPKNRHLDFIYARRTCSSSTYVLFFVRNQKLILHHWWDWTTRLSFTSHSRYSSKNHNICPMAFKLSRGKSESPWDQARQSELRDLQGHLL